MGTGVEPFIRASALPMLDKCACFESGPPGPPAIRGTIQHKRLESALKTTILNDAGLWAKEKEAVEWAYKWVLANTSPRRKSEMKLAPIGEDILMMRNMIFDVIDEEDDIVHVIDYKGGLPHGYEPQMAAYAVVGMRYFKKDKARSTLIYGKTQTEDSCEYTMDDAQAVIQPIIQRVCAEDKKPSVCDFCDWCKKYPCSAHERSIKGDPRIIAKIFGNKK